MSENFNRMVRLADEFFAAKQDSGQLDVTQEVIEKLESLHPSTLSEEVEGDGPVVWVLLIPTSQATMDRFIAGRIGERQLLEQTLPGGKYDALYLCSVLVLPEFRRQGRAYRTAERAVASILNDHPIRILYTWNFSSEGKALAHRLAERFDLPLLER